MLDAPSDRGSHRDRERSIAASASPSLPAGSDPAHVLGMVAVARYPHGAWAGSGITEPPEFAPTWRCAGTTVPPPRRRRRIGMTLALRAARGAGRHREGRGRDHACCSLAIRTDVCHRRGDIDRPGIGAGRRLTGDVAGPRRHAVRRARLTDREDPAPLSAVMSPEAAAVADKRRASRAQASFTRRGPYEMGRMSDP